MINEKIKIRVSNFVKTIIENDTQAFSFIKKDNSSNINAFLNKLLPNLLLLRKQRRELIHNSIDSALEFTNNNLTERLRNYLDTIIDKVYFNDNYLYNLDDTVWIRPTKENITAFEEIINIETSITQQEISTCIRNMLNEYCILPQFKREQITFNQEVYLLTLAQSYDQAIVLEYNNENLKLLSLQLISGYTYDQNNYVLCFDLNNDCIKALLLHKIKHLYVIDEYYDLNDCVYYELSKIINNQSYTEYETFDIKEENKC